MSIEEIRVDLTKESLVHNGQVFISIYVIDEILGAFKELAVEDFDMDPPGKETWGDGVLSLVDCLQQVTDGLLGIHAKELVPDTIPDNL